MGTARSSIRALLRSVLRWSQRWKTDGAFHQLLFVLLYTVFANLPFWIASREFGFLHDGLFCIEFLLLGLLALFVPAWLASPLLLFTIAADLACGVCRSYFLSIRECLTNLGAVRSFSTARMLGVTVVVLVTLMVLAVAALTPAAVSRGRSRRRVASCLVAFGVLCLLFDLAWFIRTTGHFPNPFHPLESRVLDAVKPGYFSDLRLLRVSGARLARIEHEYLDLRKAVRAFQSNSAPVPSAAAPALRAAGVGPGMRKQDLPNVVIVLVESWGSSSDPAAAQALVAPFLQPEIESRYQVLQGDVPFYGGTVAGEARELCGTDIGYHLLNAAPRELAGCLPGRLAALGYETVAVHGMDGHMFDRIGWYRTIGFGQQLFHDDFRQQGLTDCLGAFIGTCDTAISGWIGRRLAVDRGNPQLIHWVTLNSHLPVLAPPPFAAGYPCGVAPSLASSAPLCFWYQLVANVQRSVAQVAMGKLARPTVFVIVGDHAPPFADAELRNRFSAKNVPYIVLLPRRATSSPH